MKKIIKISIAFITAVSGILFYCSFARAYVASFSPTISISEEYTSNVFLSNENEEFDYITSISPGISSQVMWRKSGLSLSYNPAYTIYSEHDKLNSWRQNVVMTAWDRLTKFTTLNFNNSFIRTEDPANETDISIRQNRESYNTDTATIGIIHQISTRDSFSADYTYTNLSNDDPLIEDNQSHGVSMGLTYWIVPNKWGIDSGASYKKGIYQGNTSDFDTWKANVKIMRQFNRKYQGFFQYRHTIMDYNGESANYHVLNPSVGLEYNFAKDAGLVFSGGYFIQDMEEGNDKTGITMNIDLDKTWTFRNSSFIVNGYSGYNQSDLNSENLGFTVYHGGNLNAQYFFSRRLRGNMFISYRMDNYIDSEPERKDKSLRTGCGIFYQLQRWISVNLDYSFKTLDSTIDVKDYQENRVSLRITAYPSIPFKIKN